MPPYSHSHILNRCIKQLFFHIYFLFTDPLNEIQPEILNDRMDNSNTPDPLFQNK